MKTITRVLAARVCKLLNFVSPAEVLAVQIVLTVNG